MSINFYLPDFVGNFAIIDKTLNLLKLYPEIFYDGISIGAAYGNFPGALWDGGSRMQYGMMTVDTMRKFKSLYNDHHKIPIRLTMTNMLLKSVHLYDTYCNTIMEVFHEDFNNEVLVANAEVEEYIRHNYPNYRIVRSTCAAETIPYNDSDKYYMSVLDRRQNHNTELLRGITNKDKIEFVVNELCQDNCPYMYYHYRYSSERALKYLEVDRSFCKRAHASDMIPEDELFRYHNRSKNSAGAWISREYLYDVLVPMGFTNFKLVGRGYGQAFTIAGIIEYMIKPEYRTDTMIILSDNS